MTKCKKICNLIIVSIEETLVKNFLLNTFIFSFLFFFYIAFYNSLNNKGLISLNQVYINVLPIYTASFCWVTVDTYLKNLYKYYANF
jgi:hypothetical protein